ncbi:MAG: bifunctional UDP-N-acetylglucosamine diphosphorylase/glucosamine-1-phosphate N-acetyltransferase GlmU, partial [Burkholderiales bacterium]
MSDLDVVILAAGKGTRMYSDIPKVLHPLAGRPMLAHVIAAARALSARRIIVVCGHGAEQVSEMFHAPDIELVRQEPQLGTSHAVQQALPLLDSNVTLVLYGDVPLVRVSTLKRLISTGAPLSLLTAQLDDPSGYGRIVRDHAGQVIKIVEEKDAAARDRRIREVNTGLMAVATDRLRQWLDRIGNKNAQGEYYLTDIAELAVGERQPVETVEPEAYFEVLGINSQAQLARVERILQWETAQALMNQGVAIADPARIDVRGDLLCGRDVSIDVGCVFEGKVVLSDRVSIGAHCVIRNAHIGPASAVLPFSHIDDVTMGTHCRVGPYARLRPQTRLANEVHVGNFVEIKASEIGEKSKTNHLTYIGDTSIGR